MLFRATVALLFLLFLVGGCSHPAATQSTRPTTRVSAGPPKVLAVYEAWFGHPRHISVGYSSHDPDVVRLVPVAWSQDELKAGLRVCAIWCRTCRMPGNRRHLALFQRLMDALLDEVSERMVLA